MSGASTALNKVTNVMDKVPGHKQLNKVFNKIGLPTDKDLFPAAETPEVEDTTVIPTADTEAVTTARRRKTAEQMARGGRTSTILTGDKLGG
ncbi:hypothetical protein [Rahnella bonaserana]